MIADARPPLMPERISRAGLSRWLRRRVEGRYCGVVTKATPSIPKRRAAKSPSTLSSQKPVHAHGRPRWKPKWREAMPVPESSGALMDQVLARLGGSGRALEFRVFDCYSRCVGEMLRLRSEPERLQGTTLHVRVASSALAHELSMLKRDILEKMARTLGPDVVADLRTQVGTLTAH
jgi:hypothetical protein